MLPRAVLGSVLVTFCAFSCGGRRILTDEGSADNGGAVGAGSGGEPMPNGSAGTRAKEPLCHLGDMGLVEGETVHRDCNICSCQWSGDVVCTDVPCSCAKRDEQYGLSDSFRLGSASGNLPACLPTCGVSPHFGSDLVYSTDALPKGQCDPYPYVPACVMLAHESCACPNEPGPVNSYTCSCGETGWTCAIDSRGSTACNNSCLSETGIGPGGDGGSGACELTRQLTLASAGLSDSLGVGKTVDVVVLLTNQGPRDHGAYPGVELAIDSRYFTPAGGGPIAVNAVYGLTAETSVELRIPVTVLALPPPCTQIVFHLRARSFGEQNCLGASLDAPVVVPLPNGENCAACSSGPSDGSCSPSGLECHYPGGDFCNCVDERWQCSGLAI